MVSRSLYCSCTVFSSRPQFSQKNLLNNPNTKEEQNGQGGSRMKISRLQGESFKSCNSSTSIVFSSQTPPNSDFRLHVEVPRGGQLLKTSAPEPPEGRFPKFLLPRAAGRPQEFKCTKALQSPMLVRVVGREWNSVVPSGTKIFRRPHIGFAGRL